jgi:hypothetical protein
MSSSVRTACQVGIEESTDIINAQMQKLAPKIYSDIKKLIIKA